MRSLSADILENEIISHYPGILDILLRDRSTKKNIIWATKDYEKKGSRYGFDSEIKPELITGSNGNTIMPRISKDLSLRNSRSKEMAEVFTPSWLCNIQNNLIDNNWFGRNNVFNVPLKNNTWKTISAKIALPTNRSWMEYVQSRRLEIACGEAPYIISRYDTTTGKIIDIEDRIGLLDRKLRIVRENALDYEEWIKYSEEAYMSTYAYEWQGDSLLLAREAMLVTYIEHHNRMFSKDPSLKELEKIAEIISWNVWQMDGLKGVVPNSCKSNNHSSINLFGEIELHGTTCLGCDMNLVQKHNGTYCIIREWNPTPEIRFNCIKFIDTLKNI